MNIQFLCILLSELEANYISKPIQSQNSSMAIPFKITDSVRTKWSSMFGVAQSSIFFHLQ